VVALGGSAGSFNFIAQFLSTIPADSGLAFVVVLHLSPDRISNLPAILARRCRLRVLHPADHQKIEPNHVYVIPPAKRLRVAGDTLHLTTLEPTPGIRTAVDDMFNSVAEHCGRRAAGVLFSGADSDGAAGLTRIKHRGGLTLVQDPAETEHREMPRAAIATGDVDAILPSAAISARVLAHFRQAVPSMAWDGDGLKPLTPEEEAWIDDVLTAIRQRTGRDVQYYRRSTLWRQAERRMRVNGLTDRREYLELLSSGHTEAAALTRELLVSVTGFFRDPEAFRALACVIPELFKGKDEGDTVRAWVPGCATGEEAYSIAMLLLEHAETLANAPHVQVFAGDLDGQAVETARSGRYPATIADAVGDDRLRQFFARETAGFRVRRHLRQAMLFAAHDVVKDSALARMDLVACRNLLIYLHRDAQKRVVDTFHFSLRPGGVLFLGTAESADDEKLQFESIDHRHSIYRRLPGRAPAGRRLADAASLLDVLRDQNNLRSGPWTSVANEQGPEARAALTRTTVRHLERELEMVRARLDETTIRADESGAELQANNQELRAINQELRATTEEVEIHRQELQAINEELSTVNQELRLNLDDLGRANADLNNFMNATAIPTVFLDKALHIKRFTPAAVEIFNLLAVDIDRPLAHLRHKLEYPGLFDDVQRVLDTFEPIEHEVPDTNGRWYFVRLLPYHTVDGVVAGVVLTFVDVTRRKQAELQLRESRANLARELEDTRQLQRLSTLLIEDEGTEGLYEQIVEAAMAIMRSDFGSLQALDADRGELRLLAWRNFHPESAEYWQRVNVDTGTTCSAALCHGERIIVPDVGAPGVAMGTESLRHYRLSGIASVQSTPLTTRDGRMVGIISTHWREPHHPSGRDLAMFDVLARQAADMLERRRSQDALRRSEATVQARDQQIERFTRAEVTRDLRRIELKK
jgi:chemotaxis methyl-accepting protein methylase